MGDLDWSAFKDKTLHNLLFDPLIRIIGRESTPTALSLPDLYAALFADEVESFVALRPHQRHAWHALLCQIGALACLRAQLTAPPADAAGWRDALRVLTPDFPEDEPWSLVSAPDRPAFLQPVVGATEGFRRLASADALDMLVTSKNHDVKGMRLARAQPDDWLFALVTLQTMEGFLGAGNYGVSRMNGGFSNRPGLSIAPPGGVGAHVARDIERLIKLHETILDTSTYDDEGLALVWLEPWDGVTPLRPDRLDPYYVEICRRIRLVENEGEISAFASGSKAARIAFGKDAKGLTGDPWTPVEGQAGDAKALTVDSRGFSYERLSRILFADGFAPAPLQKVVAEDGRGVALTLVARALARGQGKTEGLHERRILVSPTIIRLLAAGQTEELLAPCKERINDAGLVRRALRFGLMVLFQNGPDDFKPRDPNSDKRTGPFLDRFEADIDSDFFDRLFSEVEAASEEAKLAQRRAWLLELRERALKLLNAAETGSPVSSIRHFRAIVRARSAFNGSFYKAFRHPYFPQETGHERAEPRSDASEAARA
jgi:CRISPR system Cascade subunit CasA